MDPYLLSLPAKPVVVFKPESAHFGDYRRCRSSHFVTGFAGIWHKREKNKKMSTNFKKNRETFERFRMLSSASERVRTHPGRSEQVQTRLRTYENFEKLAKTSRKLRENFEKSR